jgi:hypothetical protein
MIHHSMKEGSRWVHSSSTSRMVRWLSTGSCEIVPASSAITTTTTTTAITKDDRFLRQVETTIQRVVDHYRSSYGLDILLQRRTPNHNDNNNVNNNNNNNNNNNSNNNNNTVYDVPYTAIPIHEEREMVGIVRHLHERMQSIQQQHICRRCWLQCTYCICHQLIPILPHLLLPTTTTTTTTIGSSIWMIRRIFLLTHHKEIGMMMDTMKVILCAFPEVCRLVVAGIPGPYQDSMTELMTALSHHQKDDDHHHHSWTLVLYPAEDAKTFSTFWEEQQCSQQQQQQKESTTTTTTTTTTDVLLSPVDIVVMDGTWEQTRRFYNRYIRSSNSTTTMPSSSSSSKTSVQCIQLSSESLRSLQPQEEFGEGKESNVNDNTNNNHTNHPHHPHYGRQLRPHPIAIREIATAYALQLLLQDIVSVMGTTTTTGTGTGAGAVGTGNCHSPPCTFYEYQQIATMAALRQQQQPILYDGTNHQS